MAGQPEVMGRGGALFYGLFVTLISWLNIPVLKEFAAQNGGMVESGSKHGRNREDLIIDVPVGAIVTDKARSRVYEFLTEGLKKFLKAAVAV